jgi:hypothetical protein
MHMFLVNQSDGPGLNAAVNSVGLSNCFAMRNNVSLFIPLFNNFFSPRIIQAIFIIAEIIRRIRQNSGELKDSDLAKPHLQLDEAFIPGESNIAAQYLLHFISFRISNPRLGESQQINPRFNSLYSLQRSYR